MKYHHSFQTAFLFLILLIGSSTAGAQDLAPATLGGRVFNQAGVPLRSIRVVLLDVQAGTSRETFTSSMGWYVFSGVETGRVYNIGIISSRYQAFFIPVQPSGDVFNADIITFQ